MLPSRHCEARSAVAIQGNRWNVWPLDRHAAEGRLAMTGARGIGERLADFRLTR